MACKDGVCRTQWAHQLPQCVPVFSVLLFLFSVKIWDKTWHVKMVFVGHSGPINSLGVYPFGPAVMSVSADSTIRVWNLETCDVVDW